MGQLSQDFKRLKYSQKRFLKIPKDLWKALNSVGRPSKSDRCTVSALTENEIVKHDTK